jgi:D-tyrosyl-tRNA(Tyr) deacylase
MRAVIQRVSRAQVTVAGEVTGSIGQGLVVLLGVAREDTPDDARYLAEKVCGLRIFGDQNGKMNRALPDVGGGVLVISQFTLLGDCRRGRRPSYGAAAEPELAERLYERFVDEVGTRGLAVACGRFRQQMDVELVNSGPVTVLLDSRRLF